MGSPQVNTVCQNPRGKCRKNKIVFGSNMKYRRKNSIHLPKYYHRKIMGDNLSVLDSFSSTLRFLTER